jgi:UDP-N-acetylmuramyl tripeptide synthase
MTEIFMDQRDELSYLEEPQRSAIALHEAITRILTEGDLSDEDRADLLAEAKAEAIRHELDADRVDQIEQATLQLVKEEE